MSVNYLKTFLVLFAYLMAQMNQVEAQSGVSGRAFSVEKPPFSSQSHPLAPTALWGSLQPPYPTGAFWTNVVLGNGDNPSEQLPYIVKSLSQGLQISAFFISSTPNFVISGFQANMMFSSSQTATSRSLTRFDLLSFEMTWSYADAASKMTTPVVRGSPYITALYDNLNPTISTIHAILSVNGVNSGTVSGSKFKVTLNNGQTWLIYSTSNIQFNIVNGKLVAANKFSGTLRLALLSNANLEATLDASKNTVPLGGKVSFSLDQNTATITFDWLIQNGSPSDLLLYALPHHIDSLISPTNAITTGVRTIKGVMKGVIGSQWKLQETVSSIGFFSKSPITSPSDIQSITDALQNDKNIVPRAPDPYFFGKQIALMGRHALIADEFQKNATASEIRTKMKNIISSFLSGTNNDPLRFDSTWNGICSKNGLKDPGADFGNGFYNDHHFHYGYFLYALAAIGKEDPTFLSANKESILALVRDIANPSTNDPFFPITRAKDWFLGHSYAAGLFVFGDGKNQESTSEAVNAYYGLDLLGQAFEAIDATLGADMKNLGKVMLATEIRSVQKYWHIPSDSDIYPNNFKPNKMVGVLWSQKVDYTTFFGNGVELIHGIQMLPFTPITEDLLTAEFVSEEFPVVAKALTRTNPPIQQEWMGFIFMDQAIIDKQAALSAFNSRITAFDDGNSRTNALYWILSRPT